jgi:hypothetical protein
LTNVIISGLRVRERGAALSIYGGTNTIINSIFNFNGPYAYEQQIQGAVISCEAASVSIINSTMNNNAALRYASQSRPMSLSSLPSLLSQVKVSSWLEANSGAGVFANSPLCSNHQ